MLLTTYAIEGVSVTMASEFIMNGANIQGTDSRLEFQSGPDAGMNCAQGKVFCRS